MVVDSTTILWKSEDLIIGAGGGTADPGPPGGGSVPGLGSNNDGIMLEITDGSQADGFYKYVFDTVNGLDTTKTYLARTDAGPSLPLALRRQVVRISPFEMPGNLAGEVWGADPAIWPAGDTTMGGVLNKIDDCCEATNLEVMEIRSVDLPAIMTLLDMCRKYESNRTRIDPTNYTLTIYDDDCITPLRVFKLLDHEGKPTVTNVCERRPNDGLGTTDGYPACTP